MVIIDFLNVFRERCAQGVGGGNLRERDHRGNQDVDGRAL
jgi:hypothetical protein